MLTRTRLIRQIDRLLDKGHLLIAAPAGYGKSILLSQLVHHRPHSYLLSLTIDDIDLEHLQQRVTPLLADGATLLLDDIHLLSDAERALGYLQQLLRNGQPRIVLAGRSLPFDSGWLLGQPSLFRLGASELAFDDEESRLLIDGVGDAQLAAWQQQLVGWPLAWGMVAQLPPELRKLPHAREPLFAYLADQLFNRLDGRLRHFLHVTAIPLRFDERLAAALLDDADVDRLRRQAQRRNLFIYAEQEAGWWRYHDLIRGYLITQAPFAVEPIFERCVDWFEQHEMIDLAIEQALDGNLSGRAAELIAQLPYLHIYQSGRYLTYKRWVEQLQPADQARHPLLLARLGAYLHHAAEHRDLAWRYLERGLALARQRGDKAAEHEAIRQISTAHAAEGAADRAVEALQRLIEDPACQGVALLSATHNLAVHETTIGRYQGARSHFEYARRLAQAIAGPREVDICRYNLAALVDLVQGRLTAAAAVLTAEPDAYEAQPFARLVVLAQRADLFRTTADWPRLAAVVAQMRATLAQIESGDAFHELLLSNYDAALATYHGQFERAERLLSAALARPDVLKYPIAFGLLATTNTWRLRRQRLLHEAIAFADQSLQQLWQAALWRGRLALERDLAKLFLSLDRAGEPFSLSPQSRSLIGLRARTDFVRLHMLLTVACRQQRRSGWQRHLRAALRLSRLPGFERLGVAQDRELAQQFWQIALVENLAEAQPALIELGDFESLTSLLDDSPSDVAERTLATVAAIGDERAMPLLSAHAGRRDAIGRAAGQALDRLQQLPPPPLEIRLMGEFELRRGGQPVAAERFHRPIVVRLLQYLALHRGKPLARDRILEDLWPDSDPQKGWAIYRSVYSRLRRVLEPYMPSNGPNRYVSVERESVLFDPLDVVAVDSERFGDVVRPLFERSDTIAVTPAQLQTLEAYQPLLPDLPYADWLLEPRQRLEAYYIEGCLAVARRQLAVDEPEKAAVWAQRVVHLAPWRESAYQSLMRAYARQGDRTRALAVYYDLRAALQQELAVLPSQLSEWLRQRLEQGDAI